MKKLLLTCLWALLLVVPTTTALSQDFQLRSVTQKITIENGNVYVNGKEVPNSDLPKGLRELDEDTNVTFWTNEDAVIEINGLAFTYADGRFEEADEDATSRQGSMVFFSSDDKGGNIRLYQTPDVVPGFEVRTVTGGVHMMDSYVAELNERAAEFDKLTIELQQIAPESNELARRMVVEAENTARIARAFPRVQYESYLSEVRDSNQFLYQELMREREMEARTHQLAMRIRQEEQEAGREKLTSELRNVLTEIFELKQENRQHEIEQLSQQLSKLTARLEEREALKADIIESRVKDLLEQHRW